MVLFQKAGGILIIAVMLSGCGANYHLKRAQHHIRKAEALGSKWSSDTLFKKLELKIPGAKVEFIPKILTPGTPMIFVKDSVRTEVLVVDGPGVHDTVKVFTDCPDRVIIRNIPVEVNRTIKAKSQWKNSLYWFVAGLIIGFIACLFFFNRTGGKIEIDLSDVQKRKN
jgi:hypothetical protein